MAEITEIKGRLGFRRLTRLVVFLAAVTFLSTACGSSDDTRSTSETEGSAAEPFTTSTEAAESNASADDGAPAGDWPTDVAHFLDYDLQRQEVMNMSGALLCCTEGPPNIVHWEIRCAWVDEQARLALDARPTAPADAGEAWAPYIQLVDAFWTQYQNTCKEFRDDQSVVDSDPAFGASLFETGDARLAACETVLVGLEPLPADAPTAYCQYPSNVGIPIETFPDLPQQLADFLLGGPGDGGPGDEAAGPVDAAAGPTFELGLLEPGEHAFTWFEPMFMVEIDEPWLVESMPDRILLIDGAEGDPNAVIELMGPGGIADPTNIVAGEEWTTGPVPTIPVPADLTDWVEQMPLIGEATPVTIGGVDGTHWRLEYDRESPGNDVIVYAWQEIDGAVAVSLGDVLNMWHVPRPDGALLIIDEGGGPEPSAPRLFDNLAFG